MAEKLKGNKAKGRQRTNNASYYKNQFLVTAKNKLRRENRRKRQRKAAQALRDLHGGRLPKKPLTPAGIERVARRKKVRAQRIVQEGPKSA